MDLGVTHRSAVDIWECDQMAHMNVRFHGARFSAAEAQAFAVQGLPHRPSLDDSIRFMRELRCGAAVRIESERTVAQRFVHRLFDGDATEPSAILEARYVPAEGLLDFGESPNASPWSLCGRTLVRAVDCDGHGLGREAILGLVNHAGIHLGIDRHKPRDVDGRLLAGSATVACRIVRHAPAGPGALVSVESRWAGFGHTSLRLQHRITDDTACACVARVELTLVFFDMATRRPTPLPESLRLAAAFPAAADHSLETDR